MRTLIKSSLKLLFRNKSFWFFLVIVPILSTFVLQQHQMGQEGGAAVLGGGLGGLDGGVQGIQVGVEGGKSVGGGAAARFAASMSEPSAYTTSTPGATFAMPCSGVTA